MHSEPVQIYKDVCRSLWGDAGMLGCLLKVDIRLAQMSLQYPCLSRA